MEADRSVPKSFGCLPHGRSLRLSLPRSLSSSSRSSTRSHLSSPRTPTKSSPLAPRRSSSGSFSREDSTKPIIRRKLGEELFQEVFRRFDTDSDGKISGFELRAYFGSVGEYMSHEEAKAVIDDLDSDGDGLIDYDDFKKLMGNELAGGDDDDDDDDDLKAAFEIFEMERGSGRITPKSLQRVLSRLGDSKSYEECVSMIRVFDTDGDGELDYHDFQQMMMAS